MKTLFSILAAALASQSAWSGQSIGSQQAAGYFAPARIKAEGSLGASSALAALFPNPDGKSLRLEVWRKTESGYELLGKAQNAGCVDCSGASRKDNPSRVFFESEGLHVEYQGGGAGFGYWAWRSSWAYDSILSALRPLATQRIGASEDGEPRHTLVHFAQGNRWSRLGGEASSMGACRAEINSIPSFSALSLQALFDGSLDPDCRSGTEKGDPLAITPAMNAGLGQLLKPSENVPAKVR